MRAKGALLEERTSLSKASHRTPEGEKIKLKAVKRRPWNRNHPGLNEGYEYVDAHHKGKNVGYLTLGMRGDKAKGGPGYIEHVKVLPEWQRKGIATAMFQHAQRKGMTPRHSDVLSDEGRAWKESLKKNYRTMNRDDPRYVHRGPIPSSPHHLRHEDYREMARKSKEWKKIHRKIKNQTHAQNVEMMNSFGNYINHQTYLGALEPEIYMTPKQQAEHAAAIKYYGKRMADIRYDERIQARSMQRKPVNTWQEALERRQGRGGTVLNEIGKAKERWKRDVPVVVTGTRYGNDEDAEFVRQDLDALAGKHPKRRLQVHHGGARGIDASAGEWARTSDRHSEVVHRADWKGKGRAAGPLRNQEMIDSAKPKYVYAYPKGESKGTRNAVKYAQDRGYRVNVREL